MKKRFFQSDYRRQRGLSLVEVGLIVVVIGLLAGASLVPFVELIGDDTYRDEEKRMDSIHDAIVGYALSHRTGGGQLELIDRSDLSRITRQQIQLPTGRPYLPCPDINGDGYEDRTSFGDVGLFADANVLPLSIVVTLRAPVAVAAGYGRGDHTAQNDLVLRGNCVVTRGVLPWKTLGVHPTDYWGNYYTYQVDDVISNAFVGFSQDTIIDVHDIRMPLVFGEVVSGSSGRPQEWFYDKRRFNKQTYLSAPGYLAGGSIQVPWSEGYKNTRDAAVICDGSRRNIICNVSRENANLGTVPGVAVVIPEPRPLLAGRQVTSSVLYLPRRNYFQGEVLEGVPYVIVSHGQNSNGAISRHLNESQFKDWVRSSPSRPYFYTCAEPAFSTADRPASITVRLDDTKGTVPYTSYSQEVYNFPIISATSIWRCPLLGLDGYPDPFFVKSEFVARHRASRSFGDVSVPSYADPNVEVSHPVGFDDIVIWSTTQELMQRLIDAGVLPLADSQFPLLIPVR